MQISCAVLLVQDIVYGKAPEVLVNVEKVLKVQTILYKFNMLSQPRY